MPPYKFQPDFGELLRVLDRKKPSRPVLFELFLNQTIYEALAGRKQDDDSREAYFKLVVDAFQAGGYDYASVHASEFNFPVKPRDYIKTVSLNDGFVITDEKSFDEYKWPDPDDFDCTILDKLGKYMPDGMKLMILGPCGVLENAIALTGYENLCYMLAEEPGLTGRIFDEIGSRLLKYYKTAAEHDAVGIIMSNDDWGFNTQTFLSPAAMRKYVFPWHRKIVEAAHANNKPAVLHSCGFMGEVMDDIIDDMHFNGKHSYEDLILPVEDSYRRWGDRIAVLGGIDLDFLVRSTPEEIGARCSAMLDLAEEHGSYALGSGNSVPEFIPHDRYHAMINSAHARRV